MPSEIQIHILLVDDLPEKRFAFTSLLDAPGWHVVEAESGKEALKLLQTRNFALILLDVRMPTLSGFETARLIRAAPDFQNTPILFLTASDSPDDMREAYALGAVDFLSPPVIPEVLRAKVSVFAELFRKTEEIKHQTETLEEKVRERTAELLRFNESLQFEIKERRRVETEGRHMEERFRLMVENVRDYAIIMLDRQGRATSWNEGVERILGYGEEEFLAMDGRLIFTPEDRQHGVPEEEMKKAEEEGRAEDERWHLRKDGSRFWASGVITAIRDAAGDLQGWVKIMRDMSIPKKAQEDLRRSETRYQTILNSALDAIVSAGEDGLISVWNGRAESLFGWSSEEAIGRPLSDLIIPPIHREAHNRGMKRFLETGEGPILNRRIEINALKRDGEEFPVELTVSQAKIGEGWFFSAFIRDIAEQQENRSRLQMQNAISRILAESPSMEAAINGVLKAICLQHSWECGALWEVDGQAGALRCTVFHICAGGDLQLFEEESHRSTFVRGKGFPGRVWESGQPLWIDDLAQESDFPRLSAAGKAQLRSAFALPILAGEKISGVLEFFSRRALTPTPSFLEMFQSISSQLGQFIERQKAEEELRRSEEQLSIILEGIADAIMVQEPSGNLIYANEAAARILDFPSAQALLEAAAGPQMESLREKLVILDEGGNPFPPDQTPGRLALQGLETPPLQLRYRFGPEGKERWVVARARPILNEEGKVQFAISIIQDITEIKNAEMALKESEQQLSLIFHNVSDIVTLIGVEGPDRFRCLTVNSAYLAMSSRTRDQVIGKRIDELMTESDYRIWLEKAREVLSSRKSIQFENQGFTLAKTHNLEHRWTPICMELGECTHILIVARDITDLKKAEEQLRQSQKMEAVGRLAGGIAHDFNNLLTAINGYSQLALERLPQIDPLREPLEEIKNAGERAASLTRQLLAYSRKQILSVKIVNLNGLVEAMDKLLKRLIGEDINLVTKLDPELGVIKADSGQIEQIILNLALNARDAMPQGGKLTLETHNVDLDENYASGHLEAKPGPYAMLAVSDTGTGMSAKLKKQIFEPFFTTKEVGKGTGLGLSSVYGIVKQSGGSIMVYSEPGQGSTFKIYLPLVGVESGAISSSSSGMELAESPKGRETILLVEDEESVRKYVRHILTSQGYAIVEARDGVEALEIGSRIKDSIHLLVTDIVMPNMNGRKLAESLKALHPEMKVLFMSGYTDSAIVHHEILEEDANYLQKPFSPSHFARKVRKVLDSNVNSIG